ncbi:hypothetical protein NDU88_003522 [Pleurodeles waltl]|uniref:Uncharacterized protein n=1 Tax=Pleurodeles waltl TaxID=8319 RepID=A0AAV7M4V8_PLEWA|nr:hypothetical protein NDU88_003522 [Pleurodeles waltl]
MAGVGRLRSGAGAGAKSMQETASQDNQKLDAVLAAVERIGTSLEWARTSLEGKIDKVASDLTLLHADHRKLADKAGALEMRLDGLTSTRLENIVGVVLAHIKELESRAEDAEGRTRRNNIRVVGLPEGVEGRDAVAYAETWLRGLVPAGTLSSFFSVEHAHRIPTRAPPLGSGPRPFILCLLHFADRDNILRSVRSSSPPRVENAQVMLVPDYTLAVQKDCASYLLLKRKLRNLNLKYSLLFPGKLRIIANS